MVRTPKLTIVNPLILMEERSCSPKSKRLPSRIMVDGSVGRKSEVVLEPASEVSIFSEIVPLSNSPRPIDASPPMPSHCRAPTPCCAMKLRNVELIIGA